MSFLPNRIRPWGRGRPGSYYWHGNQPDIHAAYLFNDAGRPDLTQKWARWILDHKYGDGYDGLDGNDDAGTLSAWYIFSALGLYPVAGSDKYELGAPLFEKAEVKLKGKPLVIVAENYAPNHPYVSQVRLNDMPLDRTWLRHAELAAGGVLKFLMSPDAAAAAAVIRRGELFAPGCRLFYETQIAWPSGFAWRIHLGKSRIGNR